MSSAPTGRFYSKDEADKAYKAYMSDTSAPDVYAPPDPRNVAEQRLDVYIEPAHAMQYRVGFMLFRGTHPSIGGRQTKRRKRKGDVRRDRDKVRRPADTTALTVATKRPGEELKLKVDKVKRPRATGSGGQVAPGGVGVAVGGSSGAGVTVGGSGAGSEGVRLNLTSLFRKRDDAKAAGKSAVTKAAKHPKRPVKTSAIGKERKDVDTNRFGPPWLIEEDWALLSAVRTYLSPSGNVNWYLVSDVVNTSTSFTGRYRSRQMCRDRYFSTIMPREDGKGPATKEKTAKPPAKDVKADPKAAAVGGAKGSKDIKSIGKDAGKKDKEAKAGKDASKEASNKEASKEASKDVKVGKEASKDASKKDKDGKGSTMKDAKVGKDGKKDAKVKEEGGKDMKPKEEEGKDGPPSKKPKKEAPPSPKAGSGKPKVFSTAKLLEMDKRQSLMDFHKHMFSAIYKAVQARKEPKAKRTEQATSHAKVLQTVG